MRAAPRPDRERDAGGDHRLAGARLPGEDAEAGSGFDIELVDHAETRDVELSQHARILARASDTPAGYAPSSGSPGRSNLSRTRATNGAASGRRTNRAGWSARPIRTAAPTGSSTASRPSAESSPGSSPTTSTRTTCSAPSTNDRSNTICGATAVTTSTPTDGDTMGPRAEDEDAVEPVGAAATTPSAANVVRYSRAR